MEEQVRKEAVEFDHDPGRDCEPDRGEYRGGGKELFHGWSTAGSAGGNGDLAVGGRELVARELFEGSQGPGGRGDGALQGQGKVDLDLLHVGVFALDRLQVGATGPADATSDVEEGDARDGEVTGMVPAAIHDQVGQAIGATYSLAIHGKAGFSLGGFGPCGPLLEAGIFAAGGEPRHVSVGQRREAEDQKAGKKNGEESSHDGQGRSAVAVGRIDPLPPA